MRKTLYTLLILAMVSSFGAVAFGATATVTPSVIVAPAFSDIAGADGEFELAALGAMGVFTGDTGLGGAVRPTDPITRAEFCKVVITAMGKASIAAGLIGLTPAFIDGASIPAWAWGFVNAAQMMGIINGYADGSFKAGNPVLYSEAATMVVRAVPGHTAQVPAGVWPYNYLWYALDNHFTGEADLSFPTLPCARGDMAMMVYATMQVDQLKADGDEFAYGTDVLHDRLDTEYTLVDYTVGTTVNTVEMQGWGDLPLAAKVVLAKAPSLEGLRNLLVDFIWDKDPDTYATAKVIFIGARSGESSAFTGTFQEDDYTPEDDVTGYLYLAFIDGTVIPYDDDDGVDAKINGQTGYDEEDLVDYALGGSDLVTVTKDDDGFAINLDVIRVTKKAWIWKIIPAATVNDPTVLYVRWKGSEGNISTTYDINKDAKVLLNGALAARGDLKINDVVYLGGYGGTDGAPVVFCRAVRNTVEGTVKASRTTDIGYGPFYYATIGEKEYRLDLTVRPAIGDVVKYGLEERGRCYVPISYALATDAWWFKSFTRNPSPLVGDSFVVDIGGTEVTYKGDGDYNHDHLINAADLTVVNGWLGLVCYVDLDDSRQINWDTYALCATEDGDDNLFSGGDVAEDFWWVVTADAASGMVVLGDSDVAPHDFLVINLPGLAVYELSATYYGSDGVYYHDLDGDDHLGYVGQWLGIGGLEAGDVVFFEAEEGVLWVWNRNVEPSL